MGLALVVLLNAVVDAPIIALNPVRVLGRVFVPAVSLVVARLVLREAFANVYFLGTPGVGCHHVGTGLARWVGESEILTMLALVVAAVIFWRGFWKLRQSVRSKIEPGAASLAYLHRQNRTSWGVLASHRRTFCYPC